MEKLNEEIAKNAKDESLKAMTRFGSNEVYRRQKKKRDSRRYTRRL